VKMVQEYGFMDAVVKWHCRNFNPAVLGFAEGLLAHHGIEVDVRRQFGSFYGECMRGLKKEGR